MDSTTKSQIEAVLTRCVNRTIVRVAKDATHKPFHKALLTKELAIASTFERSFSTSFGQGPVEEISQIIALSTGAESERQKVTRVNVNKGAVDEIERILSALRSNDGKPHWKNEIERISAFKKGDFVQRRVVSDLWIKRGKEEIFLSIKTVKPNIDQTEIAKRTLLLLKAHDSNFKTYFGLYYNPGGENKEDYNWSVPSKIFDMLHDECVLIGRDYWDFIGGKGTYKELLEVFATVGKKTQKQLKKLGH